MGILESVLEALTDRWKSSVQGVETGLFSREASRMSGQDESSRLMGGQRMSTQEEWELLLLEISITGFSCTTTGPFVLSA